MAPGVAAPRERRAAERRKPEDCGWQKAAVLRPGLVVEVLDLGAGGARIVSAARLKPGARAELQLTGTSRRGVVGRIGRCRVIRLRPLRYEAAIVFDIPFTG